MLLDTQAAVKLQKGPQGLLLLKTSRIRQDNKGIAHESEWQTECVGAQRLPEHARCSIQGC
jgi:hypothetical protein